MHERAIIEWADEGPHTAQSAIAELQARNARVEQTIPEYHAISVKAAVGDETEGLRTAHADLLDIHEALDQEYANVVMRFGELQSDKDQMTEALAAAHEEIRQLSAMKADLERAASEAQEAQKQAEWALHQTGKAYDELHRSSLDLERLRMGQMGRVVDSHLEIVTAAQQVVEYQSRFAATPQSPNGESRG